MTRHAMDDSMASPAIPHAERLTDWEPRLAVTGPSTAEAPIVCVRCHDGEKPCVQGNPNWCDWRGAALDYLPERRRTAPAIPHADRLCVGEAVTAPRTRRRRWSWAQIAAPAICAALGVMTALAIAGPIPAGIWSNGAIVVDGDTIRIGEERVRLFGIDAPEMRQTCLDASRRSYACGEASANALRAMIARDPAVACRARDRDRYGRMVAQCRNGDGDLGARLVAQGWAVAYTRYSRAYVDHEAAARAERLGMHAGTFTPPEQYRRESRQ